MENTQLIEYTEQVAEIVADGARHGAESNVKPTIPDVVERFADYYVLPGNGAWGSLHIVLDDQNVRRSDVEFCRESAVTKGDVAGAALAEVLALMSKTQRLKLPDAVDKFINSRKNNPPPLGR